MKKIVLLAPLLVSCDVPVDITATPGFGAKREQLFRDCLQLAAVKQQSTHYADEVIGECSKQAYYLTVSLAKSGDLK